VKKSSGFKDPVMTFYVRHFLDSERRTGRTFIELAKAIGCKDPTLSAIYTGTQGVGRDVEQGVADYAFGGSIDALRRAAKEHCEKNHFVPPAGPNQRICETSEWPTCYARAKELASGVPEWIWHRIAQSTLHEVPLRPELLVRLALLLLDEHIWSRVDNREDTNT
jgi:hypothetical protein